MGVTGGIDTLCSQTHGAGGHRLVGITLQRGVWITLVCCLPVLALYTQVSALETCGLARAGWAEWGRASFSQRAHVSQC